MSVLIEVKIPRTSSYPFKPAPPPFTSLPQKTLLQYFKQRCSGDSKTLDFRNEQHLLLNQLHLNVDLFSWQFVFHWSVEFTINIWNTDALEMHLVLPLITTCCKGPLCLKGRFYIFFVVPSNSSHLHHIKSSFYQQPIIKCWQAFYVLLSFIYFSSGDLKTLILISQHSCTYLGQ